MKKGFLIFLFLVFGLSFSITKNVQAAECNPQCVYSGRCADSMEFLPGSTCGSSRAPGILCQVKGCTPPGTPTCASPNTCVDGATGCTNGRTRLTGVCPNSGICCTPAPSSGNQGPGSGNNNTTSSTTPTVTQGPPINITVTNPLRYNTVEGVLTSVMNSIKGIVVILALLMIIIGGIMYILSFGNPENMKRAKNVIIAALVGLAIVIAAPAFLREISVLLGWNNAPAIEGGTNLTLTQIARNILNFLLSIIGILALIMMIVSGIMYLTSGGNDARMKQAKDIFIASLIGITLAMASLVLVSAVARFFV